MAHLAQQLGRTVPELYRMIVALSDRGYVAAQGHGYVLTPKAFCLGLGRPDVHAVLTLAGPAMDTLSRVTGRTCYLTTADDRVVAVIAAQSSPGEFGLEVRIGMRQPLMETAAGLVHFGFQSDARKDRWRQVLSETEDAAVLSQFLKDADHTAFAGQAERPHRHMDCLTELSSPLTGAAERVFALSLLYMVEADSLDLTACRAALSQTARQITHDLRFQRATPDRVSREAQPKEPAEIYGQ